MASAKAEAKKYLGSEDAYINLAGLNNERNIANQTYNTNMTSFQNAYNDLLNTIANNRQKARLDFGSGRATVNENAFLRDRESSSDLASRGLRGGIAQLNKIGNRMETGRQYSNLANTFYNTMNELDATQKTGENEYNTNVETAKNTLEAALADIGAREANARNAYRAQVAQLAEQIQARRDAAAQAAAYLRAQRQSAKDAATQTLNAKLSEIAGKNPTEESYKKAMSYYKQVMGGNDGNASRYLNSIGIGRSAVGTYGPQTPWGTTKTASTATNKGSSLANLISLYTPSITANSAFSNLLRR